MKLRWLLVLLSTAAVVAGCASQTAGTPIAGSSSVAPSTSGSVPPGPGACGGKIAFFGDLTGEFSGWVVPARNSVKLALEDFAKAHPDCPVELMELDTQGEPEQAVALAAQATESGVIGVVGGMFSDETKATLPTFQDAGIAVVSPSSSSPELTRTPTPVFHRLAIPDNVVAKAAGSYVAKELKPRKVYLVDDGTTWAKDFTTAIKVAVSKVAGSSRVKVGTSKFTGVVRKIKAAKPDMVAFGGYYNDAGPLLKELRAAGYRGKFIGGDALYDAGLFRSAGRTAAEGVIAVCGCFPGEKADGDFASRYETSVGSPPSIYAPEGYDAANVLIDAIAAGNSTPAEVLSFVETYDKDGITRRIKFDPNGDLAASSHTAWTYEVRNGKFTPGTELQP